MSCEKPVIVDLEKKTMSEEQQHVDCPVATTMVVVNDAARALEWYPKALGGRVACRYEDKKGKILHAIISTDYGLRLGIEDHFPDEHCGMIRLGEQGTTYVYVTIPDGKGTADKAIDLMREAGAKIVEEATDKFYGHRMGKVVDMFGVTWIFAHEVGSKSHSTN